MVRRELLLLRRTPTVRGAEKNTKSEIEKKTRKVVEITVITLMKKHGLFKSIKF